MNYKNRNAAIPEVVNDVYEEKEYKKWLDYTMERYKFGEIVSAIDTVITLLFLVFGVFVLIDDTAKLLFTNNSLQILAFIGIYQLISIVINLYPSYYSTFVIEEKYGFNKSTKKTFVIDEIKKLVLKFVFVGGIIYLVIAINNVTGRLFFLYTWIAIMAILLLLNLVYSSVIVPIFNKLTPLEDGALKDQISDFASKVGFEVIKISVMDFSKRTARLNAFFSGIGKTKRIVLADTLIEKMSNEEIIAVLAHEIGHSKHKHIIYKFILSSFQMFVFIVFFGWMINSDLFARSFGFSEANFGFAFVMFFVVAIPISILINMIISQFERKFEYQADAYSVNNYSKEHMVGSLKKIAKENFDNLTPHPLYVKLLYSHPIIADRIKAINKL